MSFSSPRSISPVPDPFPQSQTGHSPVPGHSIPNPKSAFLVFPDRCSQTSVPSPSSVHSHSQATFPSPSLVHPQAVLSSFQDQSQTGPPSVPVHPVSTPRQFPVPSRINPSPGSFPPSLPQQFPLFPVWIWCPDCAPAQPSPARATRA